MTGRIEALKDHLNTNRAYLDMVLDHVADRPEAQVYSDGLQWTVRQIVLHLADADAGHNQQVMNIAEGRDLIPPDFDVERYNASRTQKNAGKTFGDGRAALTESRVALRAWLDTLDEAKLDMQGRHASLQIMTVEQILRLMGNHEYQHAQDIVAALSLKLDATD